MSKITAAVHITKFVAAERQSRAAIRMFFVEEDELAIHTVASAVGALFSIIAGRAFIYACWCYIKAKGRSGWWILVLAFNLLGILILALLKDRAIADEKKLA